MVGTIEPRKGHTQALEAFDRLWGQGEEVNLVIVGREGWPDVEPAKRLSIPMIVETLRRHPQAGQRLFWFPESDDATLDFLYASCTCLLAASADEGFGLPLIEAAQHDLPIIARDIPVFREVAGDHAVYFQGLQAEDLASALQAWLKLYKQGHHPHSGSMPWLTWTQSAEQVKRALFQTGQKFDSS